MIKVIFILFVIYLAYKIKTKNNLTFVLNIDDDNRLLIEFYNYLRSKTKDGFVLSRVNTYEKNVYLALTLKQNSLNNDFTRYDNIEFYTQTKDSLLELKANKYLDILDRKEVDNLYSINTYLDNILVDYIRENKESILKDK